MNSYLLDKFENFEQSASEQNRVPSSLLQKIARELQENKICWTELKSKTP